MILAWTVLEKFQIFRYNFRPEVDNDVISSVAVEHVRVDVRVKFGNLRSNGFKDIRVADFVSNEHDKAYPNSVKRRFA